MAISPTTIACIVGSLVISAIVAIFLPLPGSRNKVRDRWIVFFMAASCHSHLLLELFWVFNASNVFSATSSLAVPWRYMDACREIWEDFSRSDKRWGSADETLFGVEVMAAFWDGPFAVLTIIGYAMGAQWRYVVLVAAAVGQMYGVVMTWVPELYTGMKNVPTDPLLRYGYFWGTQAPWFVVPLLLVWHAIIEVGKMTSPAGGKTSGKKKHY